MMLDVRLVIAIAGLGFAAGMIAGMIIMIITSDGLTL
jgi:hypothetical protein